MWRWLAGIYITYLAISLLLILPALNFATPWLLQREFGRELRSEIILFNPFKLSVEARHVELLNTDDSELAGLSSAEINLSLRSLWSPGWHFDAVHVDALRADLKRLPDGEFNFSDFLPSEDEGEKPAADSNSEIPGLTVGDFRFHSLWLRYTDLGRDEPFSTELADIGIAARDLSTIAVEGRPYRLDAKGEHGGVLHWKGEVSIPEGRSEGTLSLSDISLTPLSRFIAPWVPFTLEEGRFGIEGRYRVDWSDTLDYAITDGRASLKRLNLRPQDSATLTETGLALKNLEVSGINLDGKQQHVDIASVALNGLNIEGWSEESRVSLLEMLVPASEADNVANETASDEEPGSEWSVNLSRASLRESGISWRSEFTSPPELNIAPVDVTIDNLRWPPNGDTAIKTKLLINQVASVEVDGEVDLAVGQGLLSYGLEGLPLTWINPNLPEGVRAAISQGQGQLQGQLSLRDFSPYEVNMDGSITDFSLTVYEAEDAITRWESIRWQALDINLAERDVVLNSLFIDGYSGRLHINEDGTINAQRALMDDSQAPEETSEETDQAWSFSIPEVNFTDSSLDFMDESLPIAFRTVIGELNGDITGISSSPESLTKVDLKGSVDGYAPVILEGSATPFSTPPDVDIALSFDGVDLARLTPYSGTYAGYAIERGILNLDLNYLLEDARLQGDNKVVISRLKLGEKIESDKAVDLPLGLAIALLTDANGVIDLAVPVSGNIDDPEFELGGVIFSAFINLITKAVTAPFNLLASLVNSDEDLQRITFSSGSAALTELAVTKLGQLNEALAQRPKLGLVIYGRLHPRADRQQLQIDALKNAMLADGLPEQEWESKGPDWVEAIGDRYKASTGSDSIDGKKATIKQQMQHLSSEFDIPESQLESLAEQRALEVKRFLVNELQLAADRAVIDTFAIDDKANQFSGVELKLDH